MHQFLVLVMHAKDHSHAPKEETINKPAAKMVFRRE
jgi:hypothetical protein